MATNEETREIQANRRLLVLSEEIPGEGPTVREIAELPPDLNVQAICPPLRLNDWMVENQHCPCGPRRYAESELAQKIEELARSNRDLEQFAFVASHDLQEPLRMVATYTQLLAERYKGKLDENADKYIHYAVDGALRMQRLVHDLLAFSRIGRQGEQA